MSKTPIGGRKCKSWRLKKKYYKFLRTFAIEALTETLEQLPKNLFEQALCYPAYDITRLFA